MGSESVHPSFPSMRDWIGSILRYRSDHPASRRILLVLERLLDRPYRTHALVLGEPGTGKEGLARALHHAMHGKSDAPFVKIPSGGRDATVLARHLFGTSERPGAISRAEGGTLFLDEVATLPREVQARLAPALRGRYRVDDEESPRACQVSVIAATDHDLAACVTDGRFRHDLYHRLARIELLIPPLRERPSDVGGAAVWIGNRLLERHGSEQRLSRQSEANDGELVLTDAAVRLLERQPWNGNFRELDRVMERALLLYLAGERVTEETIRAAFDGPEAPPR